MTDIDCQFSGFNSQGDGASFTGKVNDNKTFLKALGINPDDLFFETNGRQERLTGVAQSWDVIPGVLRT